MESPQDVGQVLLLQLHKDPLLPRAVGSLARDAWFCNWIQLTPPRGTPLRFPCYQWMEGSSRLALREGAGEPALGRVWRAGIGEGWGSENESAVGKGKGS